MGFLKRLGRRLTGRPTSPAPAPTVPAGTGGIKPAPGPDGVGMAAPQTTAPLEIAGGGMLDEFDATAGSTGGIDGGGVVGPETTAAPEDPLNNTVSKIRDDLPDVNTQIDPSQFASGDAVQSDVATLEPPTDINAAEIDDYTPYDATLDEVDPESTVEGRLEGLLSRDSDYMQRAESKANAMSNRRGMLNSSMAVGAAHGAAIDAALPIAQQDAQAYLEQQFLNQGYSNEAAKHLADASIERENLDAAFEQDTNQFNATNTLENQRLNQAAENESNAAYAAEVNKNNFATLTADLQAELAKIDNELAMNLETLASSFDILQNLDSVNGAIYQQLVNEIGDILQSEDKVEVAQAKINSLIEAAGIEFAFSTGQTPDITPIDISDPAPGPGGSSTGDTGGGGGGDDGDGGVPGGSNSFGPDQQEADNPGSTGNDNGGGGGQGSAPGTSAGPGGDGGPGESGGLGGPSGGSSGSTNSDGGGGGGSTGSGDASGAGGESDNTGGSF